LFFSINANNIDILLCLSHLVPSYSINLRSVISALTTIAIIRNAILAKVWLSFAGWQVDGNTGPYTLYTYLCWPCYLVNCAWLRLQFWSGSSLKFSHLEVVCPGIGALRNTRKWSLKFSRERESIPF